jgi:hypothetical protein
MIDMNSPGQRACVYTVLTGNYEALCEAEIARDSSWDFICLTDNPDLRSETWQVRQVSFPFAHDPGRNSRIPKACPHRYFPDYDMSLYIDNSVRLTQTPEQIVADVFGADDWDWGVLQHSFRDSVRDEFNRVLRLNLDDPSRVIEQFNCYKSASPDVLDIAPLWAGFIVRKHIRPGVVEAGEHWLAQILRYSRRDQLSLPYSLRHSAVRLKTIRIDNRASAFHAWNNKQESRNRHMRKAGWKAMLPSWVVSYYALARVVGRMLAIKLK